ncbi:Helicase conserved domain containing protein [Reticulomyxa filosa]|uniref:Helicase conserved domain containing protein n=1 Tax=Reticulomyxa filosa TaxID=46433 RepID=X6LFZ9_RETFI|nr:Helicase conserved domain containing protein [Reticulomyxa filosa]|eukprot:ETN99664.1 Helicase conserved domain containing protein [Reticulomyxa filosa]
MQKLESDAMTNLNLVHVIPRLLSMKTMSIFMFGKDTMLALNLKKNPSRIGEMIVAEHNAFKGCNVALFNSNTTSHEIDYMLEKIGAIDGQINIDDLKEKFNKCDALYRLLIKKNLQECEPNITLGTLQSAHFFFDAKGVKDQDLYLLQPQAAQIIAIFHMLGTDENKEILYSLKKELMKTNHIQIETGDDKSYVLALLGFDVSFESYSKYLVSLFSAFGVVDHIHYGTFNKLFERIINEGGDVRKLVENLIIPDDEKKSVETSSVTREVDIFFNKEFYGSCYSPAATLRHDAITKLMKVSKIIFSFLFELAIFSCRSPYNFLLRYGSANFTNFCWLITSKKKR